MRRRILNCKLILTCMVLLLVSPDVFAAARSIALDNGVLHVEMTPDGAYSLKSKQTGWKFAGTLGAPAERMKKTRGRDSLGGYLQLKFVYAAGCRQGSFRIYADQPIALLTMRMLKASANAAADAPTFPDFTSGPSSLQRLGFQVVPFGLYRFGYAGPQGPWVLFDNKANTPAGYASATRD